MRTHLIIPISPKMQQNEFTLFVAVFAATLAAVNIFNAYLNNPFILNPINDRVKALKNKCDSAKQGVKLPFAREKIDTKIKRLGWMLTGMKAATFFYNALVLCLWGWYSFAILEGEFNMGDAQGFLWKVSSLSLSVVGIGVLIRLALPFISKTDGIQEEDSKNLKAANEQIANESTETERF